MYKFNSYHKSSIKSLVLISHFTVCTSTCKFRQSVHTAGIESLSKKTVITLPQHQPHLQLGPLCLGAEQSVRGFIIVGKVLFKVHEGKKNQQAIKNPKPKPIISASFCASYNLEQ